MMTCTGAALAGPQVAARSRSGITSTARAVVGDPAAARSPRRCETTADEIEVAGVDEGRHELAALRRPVVVFHRQRDVADVEVQGVAVTAAGRTPARTAGSAACAGRARSGAAPCARRRATLSRRLAPRPLRPRRGTRPRATAATTARRTPPRCPRASRRAARRSPASPRATAARRARPCRRRWSSPPPASRRAPASPPTGFDGAHLQDRPAGEDLLQLGRVVPSAASRPAWMIATRWQCSASSR